MKVFNEAMAEYAAQPFINTDNIKGFNAGWVAKEKEVRDLAFSLAGLEAWIRDEEIQKLFNQIIKQLTK